MADIEQAIESDEERTEGESLSEQAEDLVLKFEADHPQLTSALNQVASALVESGDLDLPAVLSGLPQTALLLLLLGRGILAPSACNNLDLLLRLECGRELS